MTYDLREHSIADGAPVKLYEFHRSSAGVDLYWRYNSSDQDITHSGSVYKAVAISDDGIKQSGEAASSDFIVTMPAIEDFPQMFHGQGPVPSDQIFLTLRRIHTDDSEARVAWIGTVSGVSQPDEVQVKITCATLATSFRRGGLRLSYTRQCPHVLYDSQCLAISTDFDVFATVDTVAGNVITSSGFAVVADRYFDGGFITWNLPSGATERRFIKSHIGSTIVILGTTIGLAVADTVDVFAGCDHTRQTCQDKFDNLANYGGFPHTPGKSPFSGDPVF